MGRFKSYGQTEIANESHVQKAIVFTWPESNQARIACSERIRIGVILGRKRLSSMVRKLSHSHGQKEITLRCSESNQARVIWSESTCALIVRKESSSSLKLRTNRAQKSIRHSSAKSNRARVSWSESNHASMARKHTCWHNQKAIMLAWPESNLARCSESKSGWVFMFREQSRSCLMVRKQSSSSHGKKHSCSQSKKAIAFVLWWSESNYTRASWSKSNLALTVRKQSCSHGQKAVVLESHSLILEIHSQKSIDLRFHGQKAIALSLADSNRALIVRKQSSYCLIIWNSRGVSWSESNRARVLWLEISRALKVRMQSHSRSHGQNALERESHGLKVISLSKSIFVRKRCELESHNMQQLR